MDHPQLQIRVVFGVVLAWTSLAAAQEAAPPPAPLPPEVERRLAEQDARIRRLESERAAAATEGAKDDEVELGLFYIRSADRAHELKLHARIMVDGLFDLAHDDFPNTFDVRRARLTAQGKVFEYVGYKLGLEFGRTGDADLRDGYIQLAFWKQVQLWAGQMLVPFSTSRLTSSNYLKHPERPIAVANLVGSRDIGFQLYGKLLDERVTYWFGVYNGDGQNVKVDSNDDKDLVTRVEVRPLKGLQLSAGYVFTPVNRASNGPSDVSTVGNQATRFLDFDQTLNRRVGTRHRVSGGARFRWGPVELKGELLADYQREVIPGAGVGSERNLLTLSWFVDVAIVLTGEATGDVIEPASPFYGPKGLGTGAFELALRFEDYRADPDTLRRGFATGTDRVRSGTVTLTWIPIERLRWIASYTGSAFDDPITDQDGERHKSDHVALLRLHFFF